MLILIGVVFGAFAPAERWWRSRAFILGLISAAVFTATAMVSYFIEPDWMWMYVLNPDNAVWVVPLIPFGYLFVYALGFAAAQGLRRAPRWLVWAAAAVAAAMEVAVVAVTWDRYHLIGTRAEWLADRAHELFTASPDGSAKTISLFGPVFAVVLVVSLFLVVRSYRASAASR